MRVFVGLDLPPSFQEALAGLVARSRAASRADVHPTRLGAWHLTLAFVGEIPAERINDLCDALRGVRHAAFPLTPGGFGVFPDLSRPRVLWAGLAQGGVQCAGLAAKVREALAARGVACDAKPFVPHLTVARVGRCGRRDIEPWCAAMAATRWPTTLAREFVLFESQLGCGGPMYGKLAVFPLDGGDDGQEPSGREQAGDRRESGAA